MQAEAHRQQQEAVESQRQQQEAHRQHQEAQQRQVEAIQQHNQAIAEAQARHHHQQQQQQQNNHLQQQAIAQQINFHTKGRMPRAKADAKPKGRMTAYAFFVQTCREEHKKKHPEENVVFTEFTKKCAERWKVRSFVNYYCVI